MSPLRTTVAMLALALALAAEARAQATPFELDLSDEKPAPRAVLVLPPVTRVTASNGRTSERFDTAVHQRLVQAFKRELKEPVMDAEAVLALLKRQGVTAPRLGSPAAVANLGAVAKAAWVVRFEYTRPSLTATVLDATGTQAGESLAFDAAQGVTDGLATQVARKVLARMEGGAAEPPPPPEPPVAEKDVVTPPPPPAEEVSDADLQVRTARPATTARLVDPSRERVALLVAVGAVMRGLDSSGSGASGLASLPAAAQAGLGGYLRLSPLNWFAATQGGPASDLELELHYRRALVGSTTVGGVECPLVDDDLQGRITWRYRLGSGAWAPSLGAAAGLAQEQTTAACTASVPSLVYRGLDLQARYRQPLGTEVLALDLAVGPRILFAGPLAPTPGFSFAGELWLEVKPWSVLFGRAGARVSRLSLANDAYGFVDLRTFVGAELGAYF